MFDHGLALFARQLVDGRILVDQVIIVVGGGDLLDHAAEIGAEFMPGTGQHHGGVAGAQQAFLAVDVEIHLAPQHLEGFLLEPMEVVGVRLPRQLHQYFLAIFPVDAVDQHAAGAAEIRHAVMVRILDVEFRPELDPGDVEDCFDVMHIALELSAHRSAPAGTPARHS